MTTDTVLFLYNISSLIRAQETKKVKKGTSGNEYEKENNILL